MENYDYNGAISLYKELISSNPEDFDLYVNLGYCYMHTPERSEATNYLKKAVEYYRTENKLKKSYGQEALFLLGEAYFVNYDFDNAKKTFEELKTYANKKQAKIVDKKLDECDFAKQQVNSPLGFFVMESNTLNSEYPDYCPAVTADQSQMYFTSRRPGTTGGKKGFDEYYFEDIYYSEYSSGRFSAPKNMEKVNTDDYEATASVSIDGKQLFIYRSNDKDPGDIYHSELEGGEWSEPVKMDKPINSKNYETHASLSPDGKTIYFTSDRKGGEGGLDIYSAELSDNGEWTNAKNLGPSINTEYDEEGPFVSPDGNTLYFSSKGHQVMGGFDIFKSSKDENGEWSTPQNMGFPLNTVDDDIFFVPTNDPITAYYSSKQFSGVSSIYQVQMYEGQDNLIFVKGHVFDNNEQEYTVSSKTADSVKVNGKWYPKKKTVSYGKTDSVHITEYVNNKLIDSVGPVPDNATIYVYRVSDGELAGTYAPAEQKGKYGFPITPVDEYLVYYKAEGYVYDIYKIKDQAALIDYNADLDLITDEGVENIKVTQFDPESTEISDYQKKELEILADFLNENNDLVVDISSYGYNETPEKNDYERTEAIKDLLIENGVNEDRIFEGLSPNSINGDDVHYTIYDPEKVQEAKDAKGDDQAVADVKISKGTLVTDIVFDINKFQNPEFYDDLDVIAEFLVQNETAKIGVYGYTDTQGNADYNKKLSEKRANFVKDYLVEKGAKDGQVVAEGKGFEKQVSVNKNENGEYIWQSLGYNRRVEIVILEQGQNSKLFVKPVEVPDAYAINDPANYKYTIFVLSSATKLELTSFDFDVAELIGVDGLYNYIHGEFPTEAKAQEFVDDITNKYPKAFVFINNYRK